MVDDDDGDDNDRVTDMTDKTGFKNVSFVRSQGPLSPSMACLLAI